MISYHQPWISAVAPPRGRVWNFRLQEVKSPADSIKAQLASTTEPARQLVSAGSLCLEADLVSLAQLRLKGPYETIFLLKYSINMNLNSKGYFLRRDFE